MHLFTFIPKYPTIICLLILFFGAFSFFNLTYYNITVHSKHTDYFTVSFMDFV